MDWNGQGGKEEEGGERGRKVGRQKGGAISGSRRTGVIRTR
jgi:hypothetical protein